MRHMAEGNHDEATVTYAGIHEGTAAWVGVAIAIWQLRAVVRLLQVEAFTCGYCYGDTR